MRPEPTVICAAVGRPADRITYTDTEYQAQRPKREQGENAELLFFDNVSVAKLLINIAVLLYAIRSTELRLAFVG